MKDFSFTSRPWLSTVRRARRALPPIASISSKKIRQAFLVLAISKSSRTILAPYTNNVFPFLGLHSIHIIGITVTCCFSDTHLSDILLHQLRADHPDEASICPVGHGTSAECLSCAGGSKQQHTFWGLDAQIDKPLWLVGRGQDIVDETALCKCNWVVGFSSHMNTYVEQRGLHNFPQLLNLLFTSTNITVSDIRLLLNLQHKNIWTCYFRTKCWQNEDCNMNARWFQRFLHGVLITG